MQSRSPVVSWIAPLEIGNSSQFADRGRTGARPAPRKAPYPPRPTCAPQAAHGRAGRGEQGWPPRGASETRITDRRGGVVAGSSRDREKPQGRRALRRKHNQKARQLLRATTIPHGHLIGSDRLLHPIDARLVRGISANEPVPPEKPEVPGPRHRLPRRPRPRCRLRNSAGLSQILGGAWCMVHGA